MRDDPREPDSLAGFGALRRLRVPFESLEAFRLEFLRNLSNGGVFVTTEESFEPRELVRVELALPFVGKTKVVEGEVVQAVSAEVAEAGSAGVALQLRLPADRLRIELRAWAEIAEPVGVEGYPNDRRRSARAPIRVWVGLRRRAESFRVRSLDLSRSGALVTMPEVVLPIGDALVATLSKPTDGPEIEIDATIVRRVETPDGLSALGLRFDLPESRRLEVERLIDEIQAFEHARRLGGIRGPIGEIGLPSLVQMLAAASAGGSLYLERGNEEGRLHFEGGVLHRCELGGARGAKAFQRLLRWKDGTFWFDSQLAESESTSVDSPRLDRALLEALTIVDEIERLDLSALPQSATLAVDEARLDARAASGELDAVILELARQGASVQRILNAIPVSDLEIYKALLELRDDKVIVASTPNDASRPGWLPGTDSNRRPSG